MLKHINKYLKKIAAMPPNATEASYRTPLENLLNDLAAEKEVSQQSGKITVLHEPSRRENIGAPDFLILNDGGAIIGYVECKKPRENLSKLIGGEQLQKYSNLSDNVLLTDYKRFILLQKDNPPREVDFSKKTAGASDDDKNQLQKIITDFMCAEIRKIDDPTQLAEILGERCRALRNELEIELSKDPEESKTTQELNFLMKSFEQTLYNEITASDFADALAQTITYALLMAKLNDRQLNRKNKLELSGLRKHISESFNLIKGISHSLETLEDTTLQYLLDNILAVINAVDREILSIKAGKEGGTEEDPYFYFYENFLAAYDKNLRKSRGVYYTPPTIVKFIVHATNDILKRDFGKPEGLADYDITALDFATGTGTFMLEIIRYALSGKSQSERDAIAHKHLLKNLFGFEWLISSHAIAHLKLSGFFSNMGIRLNKDQRINVFLTNTLENKPPKTLPDVLPALTREMKDAQQVKDKKILIITGNPPYSGHGQTAGKVLKPRAHKRPPKNQPNKKVLALQDTWIGDLLKDYYSVDGEPLKEVNSKWLQDDYVKFIRFAQHKIDESEQGIVAIITNHGFLDNPTFRGMRQNLMKTFDRLYFLDLQGNARIRKPAPDGGKDENVFDIQQGVVISLLIKKPNLRGKGVFHLDLWGERKAKEKFCDEFCAGGKVKSLSWQKITPESPNYLFVPQNKKVNGEYKEFYPLNKIFKPHNGNTTRSYSAGIVTARDSLTIHFNMNDIKSTVKKFAGMPAEEARAHFELGPDTQDWKVTLAQKDLNDSKLKNEHFFPIAYRPFDTRYTYYTGKSNGFHCRPRPEIMQHMKEGENLGLVFVRQSPTGVWQHAFITDKITEACYISNKGREINSIAPLYRYEKEMGEVVRYENFNPEFRKWIDDRYGKKQTPKNILGCIYAILHAPDYRQRYTDALCRDYPRIPFPKNNASFLRLAKIGNDLIKVHLLIKLPKSNVGLHGSSTSHIVKQVRYDDKRERLYFNKDEYFGPIKPEVFHFKIGGYKPLDKFLKERKDLNISADVDAFKKAANAVAYTVNAVKKIKAL